MINGWHIQLGIMLLTTATFWLHSYREVRIRRWAFIISFAAQYFWIRTAIENGQFGVLWISAIVLITSIRGIFTHWIRNNGT